MAKMFLVTTHLLYPELRLLGESCQVGDGALASFRFLYPATFGSKINGAGSPTKAYGGGSPTKAHGGADEDGADVAWEDHEEDAAAPGTPLGTPSGGITVGVGATSGVVGVASGLDNMPKLSQQNRQALLARLQAYLDPSTSGVEQGNMDILEPRLRPMIDWVAKEVRNEFVARRGEAFE
jgi:hypothetical protein